MSGNAACAGYVKARCDGVAFARGGDIRVLELLDRRLFGAVAAQYSDSGSVLTGEFIKLFITYQSDQELSEFLSRQSRRYNLYGDDALGAVALLLRAKFTQSLNRVVDHGYNFKNLDSSTVDALCQDADAQYIASVVAVVKKQLLNQEREDVARLKSILARLFYWAVVQESEEKLRVFDAMNDGVLDG